MAWIIDEVLLDDRQGTVKMRLTVPYRKFVNNPA